MMVMPYLGGVGGEGGLGGGLQTRQAKLGLSGAKAEEQHARCFGNYSPGLACTATAVSYDLVPRQEGGGWLAWAGRAGEAGTAVGCKQPAG